MPRKPQNEGEAMKSRPFRATDRQWDDLKLVTPAAVRAWVTKEAARLRRMKPNVEVTGTAAALSPEAPLERRVGPQKEE